jgi:hypothetical protein
MIHISQEAVAASSAIAVIIKGQNRNFGTVVTAELEVYTVV